MNINELTIGQIKEIQALIGHSNSQPTAGPWVIGEHYVIRTVTMIQTGTLKSIHANELLLSGAAWVADTGRWHDFLKNPNLAKEVEPFVGDVIVGRGGIIDAQVIPLITLVQK